MEPEGGWKRGQVVQIIDEDHRWFPCFVLVVRAEPEAGGILGCVLIPKGDEQTGVERAYAIFKTDQVQKIGEAFYWPIAKGGE